MSESERINAIIEYSGLTTKKFAESLGLERVDRIYNIQKGRNKISSNLANLITTKYNNVSCEWLLTGEGSMLEPKPAEPEDKMAVTYPSPNVMLVPLVQQYAYAGYLSGFGDDEYVSDLPKVPFLVDHEYHGRYVCFEVKGDSMDDGSKNSYEQGDIVLCREINPIYWKSRLHFTSWDAFVVVHRSEGIIIKQITAHDVDRGCITVHSLNPFYQDRAIYLTDVYKLFNVVKTQRNR